MKSTAIIFFILLVAICSAARFPFYRRVDEGFCADCKGLGSDCYCVEFELCKDNCPSTGDCGTDCRKEKPPGWKRTIPLHKALFQRYEEARLINRAQQKARTYELSCSDCENMMSYCYCYFINDCEKLGCSSTGSCSESNCVEFTGGED